MRDRTALLESIQLDLDQEKDSLVGSTMDRSKSGRGGPFTRSRHKLMSIVASVFVLSSAAVTASIATAPAALADDCATLTTPNYVAYSHSKSCGRTKVVFTYQSTSYSGAKKCYNFRMTQWNPCAAFPYQTNKSVCR